MNYQASESDSKFKSSKLHIGNLPIDIREDQIRKVFSKYAPLKEVNIIRKNSQGPLKDYCYGFILMADNEGASRVIHDFRDSELPWTVAYSKDKNNDFHDNNNDKPKNKNKKLKKSKQFNQTFPILIFSILSHRKKSDRSSNSSSSSRSRSRKKKRKDSFQSTSSLLKQSVLVPVQNAQIGLPGIDNHDQLISLLFTNPEDLHHQLINQTIDVPICVRELFISGIPHNKASQDIQRTLSLFGVIERIDIVPKQMVKYAYVKFKSLDAAYKAYAQNQIIAQLLDSNQLKIYFSDPFRRTQIVGNPEDTEKDEEMMPILFIGFPSNTNYQVDQKQLRLLAEKYGGAIKALDYRKNDPQLRSYVLIEFHKLSHAKKCRRKFCLNKLSFLGDKKCDISILSMIPKFAQIQPIVDQFQSQPHYMQPMPSYNYQPIYQPTPNYIPPHPNMMPLMGQSTLIGQPPNMLPPLNMGQLPNLGQPQNMVPNTLMGQTQNMGSGQMGQLQVQPFNQFNQSPSVQPPAMVGMANSGYPFIPYSQKEAQQYPMIQGLKPNEQQQFQQFDQQIAFPQQQKAEENVFWSGFMFRGRQHKLGIDARIVKSSKLINLPYQISVNFKATLQEAYQKSLLQSATVMILSPSNDTEQQAFDEYVDYFKNKNCAGVAQFSDELVIYIVPPGTKEAEAIYPISAKEMLAIHGPK